MMETIEGNSSNTLIARHISAAAAVKPYLYKKRIFSLAFFLWLNFRIVYEPLPV